MTCAAGQHGANDARWPPDKDFRELSPEVRNRQTAAACLVAAAVTSDPIRRTFLRRRAADLILAQRGDNATASG